MTEISVFTGGQVSPSARFRVRQYLPYWHEMGLDIREYIAEAYPPPGFIRRVPWLAGTVAKRFAQVIAGHSSGLVLLQRELISTLATFERLTPQPRLLDVDDAIWLHQRYNAAWRIAQACDGVICGNDWLAEHFIPHCKNIYIVPTGVDISRYFPAERGCFFNEPLRVGWIGTSGNLRYLETIEKQIRFAMEQAPNWELCVVSDRAPAFSSLAPDRVRFVPWHQDREVSAIQSFDIGVMPLIDSEWERGKCSFKMLQYMACAIPAVVSAVGMNIQVAAMGGAVLVERPDDWAEILLDLLRNESLRQGLGQQGRSVVEQHFSAKILASQLAGIFRHYI